MVIHGYPSIYNVGHKVALDIFADPVVVQEKIDGSQFSFMVDEDGVVHARSKAAEIFPGNEGMFKLAMASIESRKSLLKAGWTYRGEYLAKPKHNAIKYARVPKDNIILYDVDGGQEDYLVHSDLEAEAKRIGLECVPLVWDGEMKNPLETLATLIDRESILGGAKVEGIVIKNYYRFGPDKKVLMAKYVSADFREVHSREWRNSNPIRQDILDALILQYRTEARWKKAIQHLRDAGSLEDSPRDIGALIKEIGDDVERECSDEIKNKLFAYFYPKIRRAIAAGFPEFYKQLLAERMCNNE